MIIPAFLNFFVKVLPVCVDMNGDIERGVAAAGAGSVGAKIAFFRSANKEKRNK